MRKSFRYFMIFFCSKLSSPTLFIFLGFLPFLCRSLLFDDWLRLFAFLIKILKLSSKEFPATSILFNFTTPWHFFYGIFSLSLFHSKNSMHKHFPLSSLFFLPFFLSVIKFFLSSLTRETKPTQIFYSFHKNASKEMKRMNERTCGFWAIKIQNIMWINDMPLKLRYNIIQCSVSSLLSFLTFSKEFSHFFMRKDFLR